MNDPGIFTSWTSAILFFGGAPKTILAGFMNHHVKPFTAAIRKISREGGQVGPARFS